MFYEAIWLNLTAEPGKRIVICQPIVEVENSAWAVLRSAKHENTPGLVVSGEQPAINALNQALVESESKMGNASKDDLIGLIKKLAKSSGLNVSAEQNVKAEVEIFKFEKPVSAAQGLSWKEENYLTELAKKLGATKIFPRNGGSLEIHFDLPKKQDSFRNALEQMGHEVLMYPNYMIVTANAPSEVVSATVKNPKPGYYPKHITDAGKDVWDTVCTKYKKTIFSAVERPDDPPGVNVITKRWAIAIIIFRRACIKQGVIPFALPETGGGGTKGQMADDIRQKLHAGNVKADTEIVKISRALIKEMFAKSVSQEMFYETAKYNARYYITTYRKVKLAFGVLAKDVLKDLVAEHGYTNAGHGEPHALKKLDSVTSILWELDPDLKEKSKVLYAYTTCYMSKDQAIIMLDLPDDIQDQKLLKMLKIAGRNWVKGGQAKHLSITQLVQGSVSDVQADSKILDDSLILSADSVKVSGVDKILSNVEFSFSPTGRQIMGEFDSDTGPCDLLIGVSNVQANPHSIKCRLKVAGSVSFVPSVLTLSNSSRNSMLVWLDGFFDTTNADTDGSGTAEGLESLVNNLQANPNMDVEAISTKLKEFGVYSDTDSDREILAKELSSRLTDDKNKIDAEGIRSLLNTTTSSSNWMSVVNAKVNIMNIKKAQRIISSLVARGHKDLAAGIAVAAMPHQAGPAAPRKQGPTMPHQDPKPSNKETVQDYSKILKDDPDGVIKTFLGLK